MFIKMRCSIVWERKGASVAGWEREKSCVNKKLRRRVAKFS